MRYIDEINSFHDWLLTNSISSSARLLWFALMHYCNKTGWKREFNVAISALELDTGLSKQSIIRARNALQQSGRIIVRTRKGNQSAIYQMVPFAYQYGTQSNTQSGTQTVAYHRGTQNDTQSDTLPDTQADTQTDTLPDTQSDTIPRHRLDKTRLEEDPAATTRACAQNKIGEVVQCYQKNIRPICSEIESQKLYDLVERYGKDAVLKAIERAVLRGGRTLSYINGILLSWEQHGYDEEAEHGNEDRTNAARRRNGKPVRRENSAVKGGVRTDWSDVPDGWV